MARPPSAAIAYRIGSTSEVTTAPGAGAVTVTLGGRLPRSHATDFSSTSVRSSAAAGLELASPAHSKYMTARRDCWPPQKASRLLPFGALLSQRKPHGHAGDALRSQFTVPCPSVSGATPTRSLVLPPRTWWYGMPVPYPPETGSPLFPKMVEIP